MKVLRNLIGSISIVLIFISMMSCSEKVNYTNIGNEIVCQNMNIIFDSLNIFDINKVYNVELDYNVAKDSSIFYNYNLTKIDSFIIKKLGIRKFNMENIKTFKLKLPKSFLLNKRRYSVSKTNPLGTVINIELFNFYIDEKNREAFLMAKKGIKGGIGYKIDIYYFKNVKNKWKYVRKDIVSTG